MAKVKIDSDTIKIMSLFEKVTGARLKDCIVNGKIIFIVYPTQSGIAIGKNGSNIKKLERMLKKRCVVVEYSNDKVQFTISLIWPIKAEEVLENNGFIEIKCNDIQTKSVLIGREHRNINFFENVLKRHFNINGIRIVSSKMKGDKNI